MVLKSMEYSKINVYKYFNITPFMTLAKILCKCGQICRRDGPREGRKQDVKEVSRGKRMTSEMLRIPKTTVGKMRFYSLSSL